MSGLPYSVIDVSDELRLVQLELSDAERIFLLVDNNRSYLAEFLPWVEHTKEVSDSLDFITSVQQKRQAGEEYGYGIEYKGNVIGHMSLMHVKDGKPHEIGYWIGADYRGQGITATATTALTDFAFTVLGLDEVIIKADQRNIASNRVAEKCGYVIDSTELDDDQQLHNIWKKVRVN